MLKLSAASGLDLVVTDIDIGTPRPNNASTINATIRNQGNKDVTTEFSVKLFVNSLENETVNITRLNASESKTVSFTNVNESAGCPTFKVFADCNNTVNNETDENNNNKTVSGQVGYAIAVDGDFSDLVNESKNGTLGSGNVTQIGNTYYIRNFTGNSAIKNCAGRGIDIQNTDDQFVIMNCTVHEYSGDGVYFYNVTNGKINDSKVKGNSGKGIKLRKSTHVNITSNLVQNNTEYGIDVYGILEPLADKPKFINITNNNITENKNYGIELIGFNCTVKNNTISNNTVYGIHIRGNYSNITNNNITNNTDYGVYADNSYENYIYCNNFTDNNASNSGHQGWDNGNSNYWNTTEAGKNYTGNYWQDWQNNNGFPCNYTIDGGSNVNKRPKGLYDFLTGESEDKWAYKYKVYKDQMPPSTNNVPSNLFTTSNYSNISVDDQTFQNDTASTKDYHAAHRFNFSISEDRLSVKKINVTWNGIGTRPNNFHGATLYIWKFYPTGSAEYKELDTDTSSAEVYLTGEKTAPGDTISDYIDSSSGNMTVLVVQKEDSGKQDSQKSTIKTDYVRVVNTL